MLKLEARYVDEMVAHAREDDPNESCGILAGKDGQVVRLYRMTNVAQSPYRYSMDPREVFRVTWEIEGHGWEFFAIYHSHTHTEAYPSATDVRMATWLEPDGTKLSVWPGTYYTLVSLQDQERPVVRAFRIIDGAITEEELHVIQE